MAPSLRTLVKLVVLALVVGLLLGAPASAEVRAPAAPARTTDAAHSSPTNVIRMLVLRVNRGQRKLALNWARKPVVTKLFNKRAQGYRLDRLYGGCPYDGSEKAYLCGVGLLKRGQVVGGVYLKVQGTSQNLRVVRADVVLGERTAAAVVTYPGYGVRLWRLGGGLDRLTGTPRAFRDFVRHRLDVIWALAGRNPQCRHSSMVQVKRFTAGYARISNEGVFSHGGDPAACASGGNEAIAARWKGRWREILGTQDGYECSDLRRFRVPRPIAGPTCYRDGTSVTYNPA